MEVLCFTNFLMVFFPIDEVWLALSFSLNVVLVAEQILNLCLKGYRRYARNVLGVMSLLIGGSIIALTAAYARTGNYDVGRVLGLLVVTRLFRLLKLVMRSRSFKFIFISLYYFLPYISDLFGVLILIIYIWIAIGQHLFGGHMNSSAYAKIADSGNPGIYIVNNFNDFISGFVCCFTLLIVNNWNQQVTHLLSLIP